MRGVAVNTDTDAKYGCKTYGLLIIIAMAIVIIINPLSSQVFYMPTGIVTEF